MSNWLRDGLALLVIAALLGLVSIAMDSGGAQFFRGAAILFAAGGLVVILVGLIRQR